jgi:hypothetical protein
MGKSVFHVVPVNGHCTLTAGLTAQRVSSTHLEVRNLAFTNPATDYPVYVGDSTTIYSDTSGSCIGVPVPVGSVIAGSIIAHGVLNMTDVGANTTGVSSPSAAPVYDLYDWWWCARDTADVLNYIGQQIA